MKTREFILAIIVTAIWGANYSVMALGLKTLDPFLLAALRFSLCAIPLCFFIKRPAVPIKYIAAYGLIFGAGLWAVVNLAITIGLSAGVASLLLQFSSFFTILLSVALFHERIRGVQLIGFLFAILGLVSIVYWTGGTFTLAAIALAMLSAFNWAICNIIIKKCKPKDMLSFIVWSSLFSAPPLFAIALYRQGLHAFSGLYQALNWEAIFSICFQAYVTTLFGYWVWNSLMKKYLAIKVAPISLLIPIFGLLTSHILFNEVIGAAKIISLLMILLGLCLLVFDLKFSIKLPGYRQSNE